MGRTVYFTSRGLGLPDDILEVRCAFLQFEHRPSAYQLGAGGDLMRSDLAQVVTLANVTPADLERLCPPESSWDRPAWETITWEDEDGQRVERNLKEARSDGQNVRCAFW